MCAPFTIYTCFPFTIETINIMIVFVIIQIGRTHGSAPTRLQLWWTFGGVSYIIFERGLVGSFQRIN